MNASIRDRGVINRARCSHTYTRTGARYTTGRRRPREVMELVIATQLRTCISSGTDTLSRVCFFAAKCTKGL